MKNADYWVDKLNLEKHPEGGFFKEIYRSGETIPHEALPERFSGERVFSTSIYYLLNKVDISMFHRIKQDEIWHFYEGSPLTIHCISSDGIISTSVLGRNIECGEAFQVVVKGGCYFAAETNNKDSFSLVGCTVAPGFDFADFEIPSRIDLINAFPGNEKLINLFTKVQ
ncbi:MAG: putative cupin superfamily sugar epimerase [Desulforhopalus sp.]|jgi:predicted cupin superfamily sugar epimerase